MGSLGFAHRIEFPSTANEILIENDPQGTAKHNALFKARSIYQKICNPEDIILSADTLVTISNEILGKPKSKEEAIRSLFKLSGNI